MAKVRRHESRLIRLASQDAFDALKQYSESLAVTVSFKGAIVTALGDHSESDTIELQEKKDQPSDLAVYLDAEGFVP